VSWFDGLGGGKHGRPGWLGEIYALFPLIYSRKLPAELVNTRFSEVEAVDDLQQAHGSYCNWTYRHVRIQDPYVHVTLD
jgi:hypothetical protein